MFNFCEHCGCSLKDSVDFSKIREMQQYMNDDVDVSYLIGDLNNEGVSVYQETLSCDYDIDVGNDTEVMSEKECEGLQHRCIHVTRIRSHGIIKGASMSSFYCTTYCKEDGSEFVEFGIENTDEYAEVSLAGKVLFVPDSANEDFKKFLEFFFSKENQENEN